MIRSKNVRYISLDTKKKVYERDKGVCVICGSNENIEYDHIIPIAKGGDSEINNLQLLCRSHNRMKRNKDDRKFKLFLQEVDEWYGDGNEKREQWEVEWERTWLKEHANDKLIQSETSFIIAYNYAKRLFFNFNKVKSEKIQKLYVYDSQNRYEIEIAGMIIESNLKSYKKTEEDLEILMELAEYYDFDIDEFCITEYQNAIEEYLEDESIEETVDLTEEDFKLIGLRDRSNNKLLHLLFLTEDARIKELEKERQNELDRLQVLVQKRKLKLKSVNNSTQIKKEVIIKEVVKNNDNISKENPKFNYEGAYERYLDEWIGLLRDKRGGE